MRSKHWFAIALSIILTASFSFSALAADTIKLRFNYTMPGKSAPANGWEWWGEQLEKQTNGKVKVEYYPLGSLFKGGVAIENIIKGTADISNCSIRTAANRYPLLSVTMVPTVTWPNTPQGIVDGGVAIMKLIDEFPSIQQEVKNFKVLWVTMLEDYVLYSKKQVLEPGDLKGMNIGCGGSQADFIRSQGGGAVAIIPPQSYMNLKTGVIDGIITAFNAVMAYKLWEVTNYCLDVTMGRVPLPIIMNNESWNAMPKDIQDLMLKLGEESLMISTKGMLAGSEKGRKMWLDNGREIHEPTEAEKATWMKAFQPMEDKWVNDCLKMGLNDAPAVLKRWKEMAAASWKK